MINNLMDIDDLNSLVTKYEHQLQNHDPDISQASPLSLRDMEFLVDCCKQLIKSQHVMKNHCAMQAQKVEKEIGERKRYRQYIVVQDQRISKFKAVMRHVNAINWYWPWRARRKLQAELESLDSLLDRLKNKTL